MKNLKNALLLKQLYQLKQLGYKYTSASIYKEDEPDLTLPDTLDKLKEQALKCHLCELSKSRTNVVFGEGNPQAEIMFIGEGPGATEDSMGRPFVGRSGELLTKMIENVLLIKREESYIANIVKCRPPNNRAPTPTEAHTCQPFLLKQISLVKPRIIVTLGGTAYHYMTGDETGITKVRGTVIKKDGYTLIPTYHPSFLLRNPSAKKEVFEDLKKVKALKETLKK
jgi:DNA polymerase